MDLWCLRRRLAVNNKKTAVQSTAVSGKINYDIVSVC